MIKQRRLTITDTMQELVSEDPNRIAFIVVNIDDSNSARVYNRRDDYQGGIYIYPRQWIYWEKQDDPHKQWFIKRDAGSSYVHVTEFFREVRRR